MAVATKDSRTITQILFSRKREIDIFPQLHGGQEIKYPAKRNPNKVGYLSAMLCKACVVALKRDVIGITRLEPPGVVMVRSRSQSGSDFHHCYMVGGEVWLPKGNVTYHLGLLTLTEGLIFKEEATDLLDALQALLIYKETTSEIDDEYLTLLMHLSDELYYWSKWRNGDPSKDKERLDSFQVFDSATPPEVTLADSIDPGILTDEKKLDEYREGKKLEAPEELPEPVVVNSRFRGPQLGELVESLDLGMHCLLVGPYCYGEIPLRL
jgi:hypothetical protein